MNSCHGCNSIYSNIRLWLCVVGEKIISGIKSLPDWLSNRLSHQCIYLCECISEVAIWSLRDCKCIRRLLSRANYIVHIWNSNRELKICDFASNNYIKYIWLRCNGLRIVLRVNCKGKRVSAKVIGRNYFRCI